MNLMRPTYMSLLTLTVAFILSYAVVFRSGLDLLYVSLAFSTGILLAAVILVILFNKKMGGILKGRSTGELFRSIASSAAMGAVVYIFKITVLNDDGAGFWHKLLFTSAAAVAGIVIYIAGMALLKSPTFGYYYRWAKEKLTGGVS